METGQTPREPQARSDRASGLSGRVRQIKQKQAELKKNTKAKLRHLMLKQIIHILQNHRIIIQDTNMFNTLSLNH